MRRGPGGSRRPPARRGFARDWIGWWCWAVARAAARRCLTRGRTARSTRSSRGSASRPRAASGCSGDELANGAPVRAVLREPRGGAVGRVGFGAQRLRCLRDSSPLGRIAVDDHDITARDLLQLYPVGFVGDAKSLPFVSAFALDRVGRARQRVDDRPMRHLPHGGGAASAPLLELGLRFGLDATKLVG